MQLLIPGNIFFNITRVEITFLLHKSLKIKKR